MRYKITKKFRERLEYVELILLEASTSVDPIPLDYDTAGAAFGAQMAFYQTSRKVSQDINKLTNDKTKEFRLWRQYLLRIEQLFEFTVFKHKKGTKIVLVGNRNIHPEILPKTEQTEQKHMAKLLKGSPGRKTGFSEFTKNKES